MTRTGSLRFAVVLAFVTAAAGCATTESGEQARAERPKVYRYAESSQPITGSRIVRRVSEPGVQVITDEQLQAMRGISLGAKLSGGGGTNGQF